MSIDTVESGVKLVCDRAKYTVNVSSRFPIF